MSTTREYPDTTYDAALVLDEALVLKKRAIALARVPAEQGQNQRQSRELVVFELAHESYGIEIRFVQSVFRLGELALLPGASAPLYGLTAWRGRLLSILDLRLVLGLPVRGLSDLSRVIVLGIERAEFGILADSVAGLRVLQPEEIRTPAEGVIPKRELVSGLTNDALIVLDAAAILRTHKDEEDST
jgi:purine-binding chemotaxis protein CheW